MEWIMSFVNVEWLKQNYFFILLTGAVLVEWVMIQGLIIHVMLKRERAPNFRREQAQILLLEKLTHFQATQIERLYAKLGELSRDISTHAGNASKTQAKNLSTVDRSMLTFGEVNLKKRLSELTQIENQKSVARKTN